MGPFRGGPWWRMIRSQGDPPWLAGVSQALWDWISSHKNRLLESQCDFLSSFSLATSLITRTLSHMLPQCHPLLPSDPICRVGKQPGGPHQKLVSCWLGLPANRSWAKQPLFFMHYPAQALCYSNSKWAKTTAYSYGFSQNAKKTHGEPGSRKSNQPHGEEERSALRGVHHPGVWVGEKQNDWD